MWPDRHQVDIITKLGFEISKIDIILITVIQKIQEINIYLFVFIIIIYFICNLCNNEYNK